jgi:hypothetical protein
LLLELGSDDNDHSNKDAYVNGNANSNASQAEIFGHASCIVSPSDITPIKIASGLKRVNQCYQAQWPEAAQKGEHR